MLCNWGSITYWGGTNGKDPKSFQKISIVVLFIFWTRNLKRHVNIIISVPLFPEWSGRILSVIQCFLGLGQMIGPSFGSALYAIGGYPSPFFVSGGIQIFFCFLCCIFLPNTVMDNNEPSANKGMQILKTIRETDSGSHSGSRETLVSQKDEENETEEEQGFFYFVTRPLVICARNRFLHQKYINH